MSDVSCSLECCGAQDAGSDVRRELKRRYWIGIALVVTSCAMVYAAYRISAWFWIPTAFLAWYGTYNTIYSKGCAGCGAPAEGNVAEPPSLTALQRRTRRQMAHRFVGAAIVLAIVAGEFLPVLWPLAAIAGWFGASFYVAAWKGYAGCPEVGAIPTWLSGRHIATLCPPIDRRDARNAARG